MAGGMRNGHKLKFWTPGGSSTPIFTEEELDVPLTTSVGAAGSMLGTRVSAGVRRNHFSGSRRHPLDEFYQHESCGKCTPCREGTY